MWSLLPGTLAAIALVLPAPGGGPSHPTIASIKAHPATVASRTFEIEGHVVDIRSASPLEHSGLYRFVDASDTAGVLVQTPNLPSNGGAFRVEARLAPAQPDGQLLHLVEVRRSATDGRPSLPVVALVLSGLAVLILAAYAAQAAREQRSYLLALPLWLLPYAAPNGKTDKNTSDALPALRYEPELETEDRRHHIRLRNRKRALLAGVGASAVLTGLSGLWVASTRPAPPLIPTFLLFGAEEDAHPAAPVAEASAVRSDSIGDQAPAVRLLPPPAARPPVTIAKQPVVRDSSPARRPNLVAPPKTRVAQSAPKVPPPAAGRTAGNEDTTIPAPQVVNPPPPALPESPPVTPASPPVARPAAASPESDLAEAAAVARDGATRLVSAINARADADLGELLPEGKASDRSRRTKFLKLVKDFGPRATLGLVEAPLLAGDRGEAKFTVSLNWRGDFGVSSRKSGAFLGALRHTDGGWRFEGAQLLDNLP